MMAGPADVSVLTVCLSDIVDSTPLWESHPDVMHRVVADHDALIEGIVSRCGGKLVKSMGEGDSTFSVFRRPSDALRAALEVQERIGGTPWPDGIDLRVRIGLHTGETSKRGVDYYGETVNRAARIRTLADARQVFMSETTAELVRDDLPTQASLVELGRHALKGLRRPENIFAVAAPGVEAPPAIVCPYRGLLAFQPEDADLYFGREDVVAEILVRLERSPVVGVVGASGSGKSSLVRAGLVPRLDGASVITPGVHPLSALEACGDGAVVVDQLEELFTLCPDREERARFVEALLGRRSTVVLAIRADLYGRCAEIPALAEAIATSHWLLGSPGPVEFRRMIEGPASVAGLKLEQGLVDVMLRDLSDEPGALPLLSHALFETWERRDGRTLTLGGYRDAGGVRGSIAHTADRVLDELEEHERVVARRIFLRLVQPGEGTVDTRRRAPLDELAGADTVLALLVDTRLVTVGESTAEVAHEALIREWPTLRGWLNEDRDGLRIHRHLSDAARAWDELGREPGELYRGPRLGVAREWLEAGGDASATERDFLAASVELEERELIEAQRTNRRLRALLTGVAIALVGALVASGVAVVARGRAASAAEHAEVSKLAAQAREIRARSPSVALLLAVEARRRIDDVETRGTLLGSLERVGPLRAELWGAAQVDTVAFSPDDRLIAAVSQRDTVFWDAHSLRQVAHMRAPAGRDWFSGTFTPDGKLFAIPDSRGAIELYDVATRASRGDLSGPDGEPNETLRFSPDGSLAAAGGREANRIVVWDMRMRNVVRVIRDVNPPSEGGPHIVRFSPDGRTLAVPGAPGTLRFWDVGTGRPVGPIVRTGNASLSGADYIPHTSTIVTSDESGEVVQWDARTGKRVGRPWTISERAAVDATSSPDGRFIASANFEGQTYVWERKSGKRYGPILIAESAPVPDIAFSADGRTLLTASGQAVAVWDLSGRSPIGRPFGDTSRAAPAVAFSPNGRLVAVGYASGDAVFYRVPSMVPAGVVRHGHAPVQTVRFSPDGSLLLTTARDGHVRLWEVASRRPALTIDVGRAWVWDAAFSPDGSRVAVAVDPNSPRDFFDPTTDGAARIFDVRTGRQLGKDMIPGRFSVLSVAFSHDGKRLATGSYYSRVQLWDPATGRRAGGPADVADDVAPVVAFDPTDMRFATGSSFGLVRVRDVATRRMALPTFTGSSGMVSGLDFDARSRYLASTTILGATRLWDRASGLLYGDDLMGADKPSSLKTFDDLPLLVRNGFGPDGRLLVTGGTDTRPMLWDVDPDDWARAACAVAGRNLTHVEWKVYFGGRAYHRTCSRLR